MNPLLSLERFFFSERVVCSPATEVKMGVTPAGQTKTVQPVRCDTHHRIDTRTHSCQILATSVAAFVSGLRIHLLQALCTQQPGVGMGGRRKRRRTAATAV